MKSIGEFLDDAYFNYWKPWTGMWFRHRKWQFVELMEDYPKTQRAYPLFQLIVCQRVWIVEGEGDAKPHWFLAETAMKAAEYWGEQYCGEEEGYAMVRRPSDRTSSKWRVTYIGHTEYMAEAVEES